jgi:hypothetical protein
MRPAARKLRTEVLAPESTRRETGFELCPTRALTIMNPSTYLNGISAPVPAAGLALAVTIESSRASRVALSIGVFSTGWLSRNEQWQGSGILQCVKHSKILDAGGPPRWGNAPTSR